MIMEWPLWIYPVLLYVVVASSCVLLLLLIYCIYYYHIVMIFFLVIIDSSYNFLFLLFFFFLLCCCLLCCSKAPSCVLPSKLVPLPPQWLDSPQGRDTRKLKRTEGAKLDNTHIVRKIPTPQCSTQHYWHLKTRKTKTLPKPLKKGFCTEKMKTTRRQSA